MRSFSTGRIAALVAFGAISACANPTSTVPKRLEVPYEPTHPLVVDLMLETLSLGKNDVLYELGCGDGRIVIAAVRKYGVRAVCVDIDPQRIREAREKAQHYGVADRIEFVVGDIFQVDLRPATAVALYLTTRVNRWLRPKLLQQLAPGTRIVSHAFGMSEWSADRVLRHERARRRRIHYYVVPARIDGRYEIELSVNGSARTGVLVFERSFQVLRGTATFGKNPPVPLQGRLDGQRIAFDFSGEGGGIEFRGAVKEGDLIGECRYVRPAKVGERPCTFRARPSGASPQ